MSENSEILWVNNAMIQKRFVETGKLEEDHAACYAAFKAKDVRFDGHFFVGVSSTGIYCRPVCRAKFPKAQNCTFYRSAAAAEQAGYRPCLLCRPELAPGTAPVDASASLAYRAAKMLEQKFSYECRVEALANELGCSSRHLRRVFSAQYSVPPIQYLQTFKLLLAKSLLTDTDLPVIEVAMAAGFGSLRRFNDLFKKTYRLVPTALRRQSRSGKGQSMRLTLALGYRPPYPWQQMLDFLALRAVPGVELIKDRAYLRAVHLVSEEQKSVYGWMQVSHQPQMNTLSITMDSSLLPVLWQVLARVRHLFDLNCDPDAVYETLAVMNDISLGLCRRRIRLPGCFDSFEMAVRAILGQQVTVKAAATLAARLVNAYGRPVQTEIAGLTHVFPLPEDIMALGETIGDALGPLGITGARAHTILHLARALVQGNTDLSPYAQVQENIEKLLGIPGIEPWTAQYIAMRAMGWPDAFPSTDYGVKKALAPRSAKEISVLAQAWRPWRSYATVNLWNSLQC